MDTRRLAARGPAARMIGYLLGLALLVVLLAPTTASAAGSLVARFGHRGIVTLNGDRVLGLATQKDGRIVVVGYSGRDMLVVRLTSNGSRGARLRAGRGVAAAVAIQADGKIVIAGRTSDSAASAQNGEMVVKRFNANGSLDRTFGSGGTAHAPGAVANSVAIGPGGTIVVAGFVRASDTIPRVALARFRPNGARDNSFGNGGFARVDLGLFSEAMGVGIQRDGKIVLAGDQRPDLRAVNALVARVSSRGSLDRGFGSGGVYFYYHPQGGGASSFNALVIDSAGRIVAGGGDVQNSGPHALFVRLTGRGSPDSGFGSRGIITTASGRNFTGGAVVGARGVAIAGRGEIVATGDYKDSGLTYTALWAINSSGRLDPTVGSGGLVKTTIPGLFGGESHATAVAPDGSIYSGGDVLGLGGSTAGFVARYSGFGAVPRRRGR